MGHFVWGAIPKIKVKILKKIFLGKNNIKINIGKVSLLMIE